MNEEILIYHSIKELNLKCSETYFGNEEDISFDTFVLQKNHTKIFPLIWIQTPLKIEIENNETFVNDLTILILSNNNNQTVNLLNKERYAKKFKVLEEIRVELIENINSKNLNVFGKINIEKNHKFKLKNSQNESNFEIVESISITFERVQITQNCIKKYCNC